MAEGAALLGLPERQLWRLRQAFANDGPAGLVHGNRGRSSPRRTPAVSRAAILAIRADEGTEKVEVTETTYFFDGEPVKREYGKMGKSLNAGQRRPRPAIAGGVIGTADPSLAAVPCGQTTVTKSLAAYRSDSLFLDTTVQVCKPLRLPD